MLLIFIAVIVAGLAIPVFRHVRAQPHSEIDDFERGRIALDHASQAARDDLSPRPPSSYEEVPTTGTVCLLEPGEAARYPQIRGRLDRHGAGMA